MLINKPIYIEYVREVCLILGQMNGLEKPILAFENTKYCEFGQITYKVEQVQEMINKIREVEDKHGF